MREVRRKAEVGKPGRSNDDGRRLRLPSPALVVATVALLVALGGTSYAVSALPANSVGSAQLRSGAVTSAKVRNGSVQVLDLAPAARRALTGRIGPRGPQGEAGLSGVEIVQASSAFTSSPERTITVDCPAGKRLGGGGGGAWGRAMISIPGDVVLTANHPVDDDTWVAAAQEVETTDVEWFLRVNAVSRRLASAMRLTAACAVPSERRDRSLRTLLCDRRRRVQGDYPLLTNGRRVSRRGRGGRMGVKEEKVELDGEILEAFGGGMFKIAFENGHEAIGYTSGKMRRYRIRMAPGDRVKVELSPYDPTRGRIVYRER